MQNSERIWRRVPLENIKRLYDFPYKLKEVGIISNILMSAVNITDKLEITLRIGSTETTSTDIIDGKSYKTKFPNVIVKIPGIVHQYKIDALRDAFYFSYPLTIAEKLKIAGFMNEAAVWKIDLTSTVRNLVRDMTAMLDQVQIQGIVDRLDLMALMLLEELLHMKRARFPQSIEIDARINKIANYLQLNYNKNFKLNEIIKKNGFTRRTFFSCWNKYFNQTPMQYVQELKLEEASTLLTTTNKHLYEICDLVNYEDTAYFCKIFKKRFGLTPLQYRNRYSFH